MMYKVTKKFSRGPESPVGTYKTLNEARQVIQDKLGEDISLKVVASYCLYEMFDLLEVFDQSKYEGASKEESQQRGSSKSFNPTPFNTTPQPKGLPRSWVKDEDDNQGKA